MNNATNDKQQSSDQNNDVSDIKYNFSQVATMYKRGFMPLVIITCICATVIMYYIFIKKKDIPENKPVPVPTHIEKPVVNIDTTAVQVPVLPTPPPLIEPTTAPLPVPPKPKPQIALPIIDIKDTMPKISTENKRNDTKRKSSIVLISGTAPKTPKKKQDSSLTYRGDLACILPKGKIIEATLNTAVNSDTGSEIDATINYDVHSAGGLVLIPKGSKVFGTYTVTSTSENEAYGRVIIKWNRIDLPDGYTLNFDGNAIDNLGRTGYQGNVDNKYIEQIANTVLVSALNISTANILSKIVKPPASSENANANTQLANNIQNTAMAIYNNGSLSANTQIQQICTTVQSMITDKTSQAYNTMVQSCTSISNNTNGATAQQQLSSLMNTVSAAAISLATNAASISNPTQTQQASSQAFTDLSNVFKQILTQIQLTPTTTFDQGSGIKIYVTRDYNFPYTTNSSIITN